MLFCFQDLSQTVTLCAKAVFRSRFVQCVDGMIEILSARPRVLDTAVVEVVLI